MSSTTYNTFNRLDVVLLRDGTSKLELRDGFSLLERGHGGAGVPNIISFPSLPAWDKITVA